MDEPPLDLDCSARSAVPAVGDPILATRHIDAVGSARDWLPEAAGIPRFNANGAMPNTPDVIGQGPTRAVYPTRGSTAYPLTKPEHTTDPAVPVSTKPRSLPMIIAILGQRVGCIRVPFGG